MKQGTVSVLIAAIGLLGLLVQETRLYLTERDATVQQSGDSYQMNILVSAYNDCREEKRQCNERLESCSQ